MILDIKKFDNWLKEKIYIKTKKDRQKIIKTYEKLYKKGKTILDFEKELENLKWNEMTVKSISDYVLYREYRYKENKKKKGAKNV